jgi:ABC-2 type transport system ATP-binding protein
MTVASHAVEIRQLQYRYGERLAVRDLSLSIAPGKIFALLGPNGGGKTTLFRVLSTLVPLQQGDVRMLGYDLRKQSIEIRRRIGVVFQAASLDRQLTVAENLKCQAALYGLRGEAFRQRMDLLLRQLGLQDRSGERTGRLSGGLRRRVELAKGMLHQPSLLLLDEPSTGLDPGARSDLWEYLAFLRAELGVTVVLTTHLLEEAERADRIAILDQGRLVAEGSPQGLRDEIGGDAITIQADAPETLADEIRDRFQLPVGLVDGRVRLEISEGHHWAARLMEAFGDRVQSLTVGRPTLEDVFIDKTGHRFWSDQQVGNDG